MDKKQDLNKKITDGWAIDSSNIAILFSGLQKNKVKAQSFWLQI